MGSKIYYTGALAPANFTGRVLTYAEFQKSPEIFASCGFDVLIPKLMGFHILFWSLMTLLMQIQSMQVFPRIKKGQAKDRVYYYFDFRWCEMQALYLYLQGQLNA